MTDLTGSLPLLSGGLNQYGILKTFPVPTCYLVGSTRSGSLNPTLPALEADFAGTQWSTREIVSSLPCLAGDLGGLAEGWGSLVKSLPRFHITMTGKNHPRGTLSASLPRFHIHFDGERSVVGNISHELPALEGRLTGMLHPKGDIIGTLPLLIGELISLGTIRVVAMNVSHRGVSEYTDFPFTSLVEYEGKYYGIASDGVYLLEGNLNHNSLISAYIESGDTTFGTDLTKRIIDAWAFGGIPDRLRLTTYPDNDEGIEYETEGDGTEDFQNVRFKAAKGAKAHSWRYRISNVKGSDFTLQQLNLRIDTLTRKG